jgi:hypothetical protein
MEHYLSGAQRNAVDPRTLDRIFSSWLRDSSPNRLDGDSLGNALGAAFGRYLVDRLGMEWVTVPGSEDSYDMYAVRHSRSRTYTFPVAVVLKRADSHEAGFFEPVFDAVREQIRANS